MVSSCTSLRWCFPFPQARPAIDTKTNIWWQMALWASGKAISHFWNASENLPLEPYLLYYYCAQTHSIKAFCQSTWSYSSPAVILAAQRWQQMILMDSTSAISCLPKFKATQPGEYVGNRAREALCSMLHLITTVVTKWHSWGSAGRPC